MTDETPTTVRSAIGERRLDRRTVLGGAAGAAATGLVTRLGASSSAAAQDATSDSVGGRATFVLVHGAYSGGWAWRKVAPLLRAAGHDVYVTTATGMGDRIHLAEPKINLDTYVTDVVNLLEYEELTDVTLVGHSYGGFIITGAAERVPARLKQLVYLDGLVPEDGQSNYQFWGYNDEGIGFEYRMGLEAGWPGFEVVYAGVADFIQAMIKDPADAEWYVAKMTPQPMAVSAQSIKLGNPTAAALPRAFIFCSEEKGAAEQDPLTRIAERVRSDSAWVYRELAANHMALVNDPRATTDALLSLV